MILTSLMYAAKCDDCGKSWSTDLSIAGFKEKSQMKRALNESGWLELNAGKLRCPDCILDLDEVDQFTSKSEE